MRVDLDRPILDLAGAPTKEGEQPLTVGSVALHALLLPTPEPKPPGAAEVIQRYRLAQLLQAGGAIDLTPEEASLLRDRIAKTYALWTAGQAIEALGKGHGPD